MKFILILICTIISSSGFSWEAEALKSDLTELEPENNWHLFTSPDKSFSVELPCEPIQRNMSGDARPFFEYSCSLEGIDGLRFFVISVHKVDHEDSKVSDQKTFDQSVKESLTANKRILKVVPIGVEGGMGCELFITNARDEMDNSRARVIVVGNRRYEVVLISSDVRLLKSLMAERFFSSFEPLK